MWMRPGREKGEEDPEDIRTAHNWQRRGGVQSRRPTVFLQLPQDGACIV